MIEKLNNYNKVITYIERTKTRLQKKHLPFNDIHYYDAKRLEGIQQGIPLFENLSMAQIVQIAKDAIEFVIRRGCSNMCTHCYANAKPEIHHKQRNKLTTISYEDFKKFCNGFKELSNRLGFKALGSDRKYVTLFHDGDSSLVYLQDKKGKTHDYLDLAKEINKLTNSYVLFDTSGWNIQDKVTQKRMEELVQKAKNVKKYGFLRFNISINPFSPFYEKSLMYRFEGNKEKAEKFRNIYTDRMANVIYTMSPIFDYDYYRINFILRAFPDNYKEVKGYNADDLRYLISEIINKVEKLYIKDYQTGQKVVCSMEQAQGYIKDIESKIVFIQPIGLSGRAAENFKNKVNIEPEKIMQNHNTDDYIASIIDVNGKVYFTDFKSTTKTDIQLNYKNKNAETPQIFPLSED